VLVVAVAREMMELVFKVVMAAQVAAVVEIPLVLVVPLHQGKVILVVPQLD
jgi:hypothetical protein